MKSIPLCLLVLFFVSCAQVRSVSQTSIPSKRTKVIKVGVKKNIFFLFNFNTNYLGQIHSQLKKKCPKGSVEGILTKDVHYVYFPLVYHQDYITAEGFCVE
jgi:hypothetical protein